MNLSFSLLTLPSAPLALSVTLSPSALPLPHVFASTLPPFSPNLVDDIQVMLGFDFMRNAFLAGTAVALLAGLVGYFVVLRRLAFAADALSHPAFTGALGAVLVSLSPLSGVFGLTIAAALVIGALGERAHGRDEAVGTVLAWILGLGALFLSIYTTTASAASSALGVKVLFGSILGIQPDQAILAAILSAGVIIALLLMARSLLFASIDPAVAMARGVPVRLLGVAFLALLAVAVSEATQIVGALLIFALLVTPAATAQRLTTRPFAGMALAAGLALAITWVGLTIGFYTPLPISFLISALAFLLYVGIDVGQRTRKALDRARAQATPMIMEPSDISM
jgi:zinc/manganese transport system permease protein